MTASYFKKKYGINVKKVNKEEKNNMKKFLIIKNFFFLFSRTITKNGIIKKIFIYFVATDIPSIKP
jgi:hypothetical protein